MPLIASIARSNSRALVVVYFGVKHLFLFSSLTQNMAGGEATGSWLVRDRRGEHSLICMCDCDDGGPCGIMNDLFFGQ